MPADARVGHPLQNRVRLHHLQDLGERDAGVEAVDDDVAAEGRGLGDDADAAIVRAKDLWLQDLRL
jgi:hypothetical protein